MKMIMFISRRRARLKEALQSSASVPVDFSSRPARLVPAPFESFYVAIYVTP